MGYVIEACQLSTPDGDSSPPEKRKKLVGVCVDIVQHYLVLEVSGTTMQRAAIKVVQLMVMRLTARLLTAAGFLDDSSLFLVPSMKERSDKKWVF